MSDVQKMRDRFQGRWRCRRRLMPIAPYRGGQVCTRRGLHLERKDCAACLVTCCR